MTSEPTVLVSLREQRKQEVRSRINDAAIDLFALRGCESVTVEDICEQAEVARKTFYNYYPNKQELLSQLSDRLLLDETLNRVEMALEKYTATADRLHYYFTVVADNMAKASELERELILQSVLTINHNREASGLKLKELNASFTQLYQQGQQQKDVSKQYTAAFLADMTVGALNGITLNWVHDKNYPVVKRVKELAAMLLVLIKL